MNYKFLIFVFCIALVSSCGNEFLVDDYYDLEELPGYVAFDGDGTSVNLDDEMTTEDAGTVTFTIEVPTGTLSDVTVTYSIGGTAVFGTDFNIAGASSSGGTAVIKHDVNDNLNRDNVDLDIELLTDDIVDGTKTVTITLVSASNADGELAVGRGGKDILKTATAIIEDIDPGTISGSVTARDIMGTDTTFTPIEGVVITLDDGDAGTTDPTATTDADGAYSFTDVAPGTYTLVQTQPSGFTSLSDFDVSVDGDDADGDDSAAGANDQIPVVLSAGGEEDSGNDFVEVSL